MQQITLKPVDAVSITILVDNTSDLLVANQGPAKRLGSSGPRRCSPPPL